MVISPAIHKGTNGYVMWYVNSIEKPREICRSFSTDGKSGAKKKHVIYLTILLPLGILI